jgi:hypothetical protein
MPCQHYKEALIEAAASGSEPQGELRAHLDACANCRAAFEQEQLLFASVDAGLRVSANAEVPASLLPRVRARLDEESAPRRGWFANPLVLASAAVLVVAFIAARAVWRPNTVQSPVESVGKTSAPPQVTPSPQTHEAVVAPPVEKNRVSQQQFTIAKNTPVHETQVKGKTMPEVLVPRDQEVLFAKYAEQWSLRKHAPLLLAHNSDPTVLEPLQVPPIQIAELDVKPLAEEISQ